MLEQITFIRERVKLDDESRVACNIRMVASVFLIPFYMRLLLCCLEAIQVPICVGIWQFLLYGVMIAVYWYTCRIRMWSHSFMINYIHTALNNRGNYCPRCFSRMKDENEIYFYDEKIGEEIHTVYYANGWSNTYVEDICIKHSEELPIYQCANKECHLQTRARESSAQSSQVRYQVKEDYSFYEMPRTFKNTFRLIAGDLDHAYSESITTHFHGKTRHTIFIIFTAILVFFSATADFDILSYIRLQLLGSRENIIAYGFMLVLLLAGYLYIQSYIKKKCAEISVSHEYITKYRELDIYRHDVYLAKHQSYDVIKRRRKAINKARKANDPAVENLEEYHYSGENKLEQDKRNYTIDSLNAICDFIPDMGLAYETVYVNGCYIVDANKENCSGVPYRIIISSENGCTTFSLSLFRNRSYMFRDQVLERWKRIYEKHFNDIYFYTREDRIIMSLTIPFVRTYKFTEEEKNILKAKFEQFYRLTNNFITENIS